MVIILWCLLSTGRLISTERESLSLYLTCAFLRAVLPLLGFGSGDSSLHIFMRVGNGSKCGKYMKPKPVSYSRVSFVQIISIQRINKLVAKQRSKCDKT